METYPIRILAIISGVEIYDVHDVVDPRNFHINITCSLGPIHIMGFLQEQFPHLVHTGDIAWELTT